MRVDHLDFNALRIFVACANKGSFTLAAKSLSIPLPTVSRKMLELERSLAAQLFDRTPKGCTVTETGARLLTRISPGIDILNEFASSSHLDSPELTGRLRLSSPQSFAPWWDLLGQFQRAHPAIRVSVHTTERRLNLVTDGIDVALRVGEIADENVIARHLGDFRHILVASPDFLRRVGRPYQPEDIHDLPCAAWGSSIETKPIWRLGGTVQKIDATLMVNDYLQIRNRVLAGGVIAELPSFMAIDYLRSGHLTELLPTHPFPRSPLHLVYQKLRYPLASVRAYIAYCMTHFPAVVRSWELADHIL
ncbi:MAG: LysR family transcriptional regulator [Paracoccus sp. (in: a-proteobacteria)]|uniref:LysR family transcriptional regulator n=1 Tax=Paracoccus sp. TaxID=267 RepID=UPI0026E00CB6|nr:LysR family transcriptional regulator [Paracoccus sp. (in: a-proteobacteria)]MDO5620661.1 LysR family transcriptional regulator [Paracoccus sp. (in: a-proteobacteria)]